MRVILLERAANLGNVGDLVKVKNGYARNYLIPQGKALRATEDNVLEFEARRAHVEAENANNRKEAEKHAVKLEGQFLLLIRQAGEDGRLYGSVSARDISALASELAGFEVKRSQVVQFTPVKTIGVYTIKLALHGDVTVSVNVNVARSKDEAEIAKKEFLNPAKKKGEGDADAEASAAVAAEVVDASGETGKAKKKKKKIAKVIDVEIKDEDLAEGASA
jgi:large subunit ribosomal protein L9